MLIFLGGMSIASFFAWNWMIGPFISPTTADYYIAGVGTFTMGVLIAGSVSYGIALWIGMLFPRRYATVKNFELAAIDRRVGSQGDFFFYHRETEDGGIKRGKIPAETTVIYEEERTGGKVKKLEKQFTKGWFEWFGIPITEERYEVYLPKETITQDFELNLE